MIREPHIVHPCACQFWSWFPIEVLTVEPAWRADQTNQSLAVFHIQSPCVTVNLNFLEEKLQVYKYPSTTKNNHELSYHKSATTNPMKSICFLVKSQFSYGFLWFPYGFFQIPPRFLVGLSWVGLPGIQRSWCCRYHHPSPGFQSFFKRVDLCLQCGAPKIAKLVKITTISLGFMVVTTILYN